jgi:hypothetical protein
MSDFFGTGQPRVLNVENRNLDNVIFQYKIPPLSSEWNLINQIGNNKAQESLKVSLPSGWAITGNIYNLDTEMVPYGKTETDALSGQVITSVNYTENTFKLISRDDTNIAIVNGWPIVVRGTYTTDEINVIELDTPTGDSYRYDFVFLEVWRKLVSYTDPIYPYGNVDTTPYSDNEILYDVIGVETTKRIQIQYRIRSSKLYTINPGSDGFDMISIYPIGGRTSAYEYGSYRFMAAGSSDPGLYISGSGTTESETILNTVDGYVYAIPMFIVYRRLNRPFKDAYIHGSEVSREDVLGGYRSDRVDGKFLDVVHKDDIVDLRHKVILSEGIEALANRTFKKLITGELKSVVGKGFTDFSANKKVYPGGSKLLKLDQLNGTGVDYPNIGAGQNSVAYWKRRAYINGALSQNSNLAQIVRTDPSVTIPILGSTTWTAGVYIIGGTILPSRVTGSITNTTFFVWTLGAATNVTYAYTGGAHRITVAAGSILIGTNQILYMMFDLTYNGANNGFLDVPKKMLEYNKLPEIPYAMSDMEVYLRENLNGSILSFDVNGIDIDDTITNQYDRVKFAGFSASTTYDFGMELLLHRTLLGSNSYTFSTPSGKMYGYYILGVKKVEEKVGATYQVRTFTFSRDASITEYTVTILGLGSVTADIRVTFYIGSKPNSDDSGSETYYESESIKFFSTDKQARGITDVYELVEAVAYRESGDTFVVQSVDKPILKIASSVVAASDSEGVYLVGTPFVYDSTGVTYTVTITSYSDPVNEILPIYGASSYALNKLPNKIKLEVTGVVGAYVKVPIFVYSYVALSESPYNFYYDLIPYQGLISSTSSVSGKFESELKAIATSLGSGAVRNWTYTTGKALFHSDRFVQPVTASGSTPDWVTYIQPSDTAAYFIRQSGSNYYYRIFSLGSIVGHVGWLVMSEPYVENVTSSPVNYEVIRFDLTPEGVSNVIDRLPSYAIADYSGECDLIDYNGGVSSTTITDAIPTVRTNDPVDALPNDFTLGPSTGGRGYSNIILSDSVNDSFKIEPVRPAIRYPDISGVSIYKKVYQSYVFSKIETDHTSGKLYLAVISSEGNNDSTTIELNNFTNKDCVDLFELEGRPLIK